MRRTVLLLTVVAGAACAQATRAPGDALSRRVLLADEIRGTAAATAYDAVSRLRPQWLRPRGRVSYRDPAGGDVVVYLDGVRHGGPESLRTIPADAVRHIEHLDSREATSRFGTGHVGGAILVRTG